MDLKPNYSDQLHLSPQRVQNAACGNHSFLSRFTNTLRTNISPAMSPRKKALPFYTDEELKLIKEQWLKDKQSVDSDPAYEYYLDRWFAYKKYLNNKNLQALYGFASHLYRLLQDNELYFLFKDEDKKITKAFRRIIENGYYSSSKEEEKRVRTHLGKIVKRQTYRRYKKRY